MKNFSIIIILLAIVGLGFYWFSQSNNTSLNTSLSQSREPTFSESDRLYNRYEYPQAEGECENNSDCEIMGCGDNLCVASTADDDGYFVDTCEMVKPEIPSDCSCVNTKCIWVKK